MRLKTRRRFALTLTLSRRESQPIVINARAIPQADPCLSDDIPLDGAAFLSEKTEGLSEPGPGWEPLGRVSQGSSQANRKVTDAIPYFQEWRTAAEQIKQYAVANLNKLLVEFERQMTAKGATVLFAENAAEANRLVLNIARKHNVRRVVKSKSMVTEELELNHVLEAAGIHALETDLGEYIVQLAGQRPVHIVTPAMHMSAAERRPAVFREARRAV